MPPPALSLPPVQYTIAAAMNEVAAATLTPGMRSAPTLRDMALAHHAQQEAQQEAQQVQHARQGGDGSQADEHRRVSSSGTPKHIQLEGGQQSPLARAHASLAAANEAASKQPVLVQEAPQQAQLAAAEPGGLLAWLGLSAGSELRATPGAAAQFGLLLVRSGARAGKCRDGPCWSSRLELSWMQAFGRGGQGAWVRAMYRIFLASCAASSSPPPPCCWPCPPQASSGCATGRAR